MYKKENKRSLKSSTYFQSRAKKNKKSLLFSSTSSPLLKVVNGNVQRKDQDGPKGQIKSIPISDDHIGNKINVPYRNSKFNNKSAHKPHHSTFKIIKQNNTIKSKFKNCDYYWSRERSVESSREKFVQTPKPKIDSNAQEPKSSENLLNSKNVDSSAYESQIKKLQGSISRYKTMHKKSIKKLYEVQEKAKSQEMKYQRAKQIYIDRIKTLSKSLKSNKRNIGHLFTYEEADKNMVPDEIILEVSGEENLSLLSIQNQLQILEHYYKSTESSILSSTSLNSKEEFD